VRLLLAAKDGPTGGQVPPRLAITYPPLWQPTPMELADLRLKASQVDTAYITNQVVTPEEVALSGRFTPDGWNAPLVIDLDARRATLEADAEAAGQVAGQGAPPPGAEHAEGIAAIVAKVAAREVPRDAGVALLQSSFGLDPAAADAAMGEAGKTFFTAPDPGHAQQLADAQAEVARLTKSNRGYQAYTARLIQRAKDGGLELGPFTAREPTEVDEGEALEPGDVVAVPVADPAAPGGA